MSLSGELRLLGAQTPGAGPQSSALAARRGRLRMLQHADGRTPHEAPPRRQHHRHKSSLTSPPPRLKFRIAIIPSAFPSSGELCAEMDETEELPLRPTTALPHCDVLPLTTSARTNLLPCARQRFLLQQRHPDLPQRC